MTALDRDLAASVAPHEEFASPQSALDQASALADGTGFTAIYADSWTADSERGGGGGGGDTSAMNDVVTASTTGGNAGGSGGTSCDKGSPSSCVGGTPEGVEVPASGVNWAPAVGRTCQASQAKFICATLPCPPMVRSYPSTMP